jgi:hypothetical protein
MDAGSPIFISDRFTAVSGCMFSNNRLQLVGMKPHPLELRERIVKAVDDQYGTIAEIAEMFNVSERYVFKLLTQHERFL